MKPDANPGSHFNTMLLLNQPEVQFALHATRRAALLAHQVQRELVMPALAKEDRSPVTVADFTVQALVAGLLAQAFPGDALVGEEDADALRQPEGREMLAQVTAYVRQELPGATPEQVCDWIDRGQGQPEGRFWVLDPVDGTKGFLRGGQYAVALALLEDHQVQLGLLGCPNLADGWKEDYNGPGTLAAAQRGRGTWISSLDDEIPSAPRSFSQVQISAQTDPRQARLLRSYESSHTNTGTLDRLVERLHIQTPALRLDSQAKYSILAAGQSEAILRVPPDEHPGYREKIWDIAAGALVVEEAGGQVSDLDGIPLDFSAGRQLSHNRGILVTNGRLHSAFVAALSELQG